MLELPGFVCLFVETDGGVRTVTDRGCADVWIHQESLLRCWMMWSMVVLNREFMASGLILSIPWDDHLTKSTLHKKKDQLPKQHLLLQ